MDIREKMARAAGRVDQLKAAAAKAAAPKAKPRIRVRAGAVVTELMLKLALGIETTGQKLARWLESKREEHVEGGICPHCNGSGRYRLHTDPTSNGKCYRCDGKGRLNAKDLAFLANRLGGKGPVCWVVSAPAA